MVHSQRSLPLWREARSLMEVDLMGRLISQSAVQSLPIAEFEVPPQSVSGVPNYPVFPEVKQPLSRRWKGSSAPTAGG